MKFNIKSLLTGTTLVVASALNVNAVLPKGMELFKEKTVTHPIFGEMKVISHMKDIKYYDDHKEHGIVEDFMKYVLNNYSYNNYGISKDDVKNMLKRIAETHAGRGMLKVITANYMREFDRIKQFCERHKEDLKIYREKSLEHIEYIRIISFVERLKRLYSIELSPCREELGGAVKEKEMSADDLLKLYERFRSGDLGKMTVDEILKEVLDLHGTTLEAVKERCKDRQYIENYYPKALEVFFENNKEEFEKICDEFSRIKEQEKSDDIKKLISLGKDLEQVYRKETELENKKQFSLIRRKNMSACFLLFFYEHFFGELSEGEHIINALKFAFHTLILQEGHGGYTILSSGEPLILPGYKYSDDQVGHCFWVDREGNFLIKEPGGEALNVDEIEKKSEKCGTLEHELLHFMNDICWSSQGKIKYEKIKFKDMFKEDDPLLQKLEDEFGKEFKDGKNVTSLLGDVYNNSIEMWTMYGIFYVPNAEDESTKNSTENKTKGEFYYDPINEAVSSGESKNLVKRKQEMGKDNKVKTSLVKEKKQLVRIGHRWGYSEEELSCIKRMNEEKKIYSCYFDKELQSLVSEM